MQRVPRLTARQVLEYEEVLVENFDEVWAAGYVNGANENPEHQDLFMAQLLVQDDERLAPLLPLLQTLINTFQTNTIDWVKQVLREQQALVQSNAPITEQKYQVMITHFRGMENVSEVFCNLEFVTKLGLERLPEDGPRKYLQKRLLYMCFGIITCVEQKARCVEIASGNANNNNTRLATLVMNVLVLKKEVQCLRQKVAKKKGCLFLSQAEQQNQVRLFDAENELKEARKALDAAKSQLRDSATVTAPVTEILRSTLEKALDAVNLCKKLYTGLDLKFGNRWLPYWIGLVESVFAESASALAGRLVKQLLTPEDRAAGAMDAACVTAIKAFVNQVGREYEASDGWDEEDVVDVQLAEELNHGHHI